MAELHSKDTEMSLIGSMLQSPKLIKGIISMIDPAAIYNTVNNQIYRTVIDLFDEGTPIDIVSVSENTSGVAGASIRLSECMSEVSTTMYPDILIKKINRLFALRFATNTSDMICKMSKNPEVDLGEVIGACESLTSSVVEMSKNTGVKTRKKGVRIKIDSFKEKVKSHYINGISTQGIVFNEWPLFSKHFRIVKSRLAAIGGIPSHGKTTFTDALLINSIIDAGWKWAVFSPENKPYELHLQPLAEKLIGKPFFKDGRMTAVELDIAIDTLNSHITFLEPDKDNNSHEALIELMYEEAKEGVNGFLIDPFNKAVVRQKKSENRTDAIGRYILSYQQFSRETDSFVGLVVHPIKMIKDKFGQYPVPTLYDMEGSAHWFNGVDIGLSFYRNFTKNFVVAHVQKMKFVTDGKIGSCFFRYNEFNTRLDEITRDEANGKPKNNDNAQQEMEF